MDKSVAAKENIRKFCKYCGTPIGDDGQCPRCAGSKPERINRTALAKVAKIVAPCVVLLVLVIVIVCFIGGRPPVLDLSNYIVIDNLQGLNSQGTIKYHLDESLLYIDIFGADDFLKESADYSDQEKVGAWTALLEESDELQDILSCITLTVNRTEALSNGDIVTVTATFQNLNNKNLAARFEDGSASYTVEGLPDGKAVDFFSEELLALDFEGFDTIGEATLSANLPDELVGHVTYDIDKSSGLSNGDAVRVSINYNPTGLLNLGYLAPLETEKELVVSGLSAYCTSVDEIPQEVIINLQNAALEQLEDKAADDVRTWADDISKAPEITGMYFLTVSNPAEPFDDFWLGLECVNAICVIGSYTVRYHVLDDNYRTYFYLYFFTDYYYDADGVLCSNTEPVIYSLSDYNQVELQEWFDSQFETMTATEMNTN